MKSLEVVEVGQLRESDRGRLYLVLSMHSPQTAAWHSLWETLVLSGPDPLTTRIASSEWMADDRVLAEAEGFK